MEAVKLLFKPSSFFLSPGVSKQRVKSKENDWNGAIKKRVRESNGCIKEQKIVCRGDIEEKDNECSEIKEK